MPVTKHGRYVNPFSMLCDACEDNVSSYWCEERCQYECDRCEKDIESQLAAEREEAEFAAAQQAAE